MSAQAGVLAVLDRQLRDRAERANRYRKNAEKSARKSGEPQITADRMAAYTDLQLVELREARNAVAALIAERDALLAKLEQQPAPVDLEQFREAVSADDVAVLRRLKDALPTVGLNGWHKGVAALDRLLALIDNAGKVGCPHEAWEETGGARRCADCHEYLGGAPHQLAPVVDDALLRWVKAQADDENANPRFRELYAALARAQGVRS